VANSVFVTLLRGEEGVHLILANLSGVSYKSAPGRFREIRSTVEEFSRRVVAVRSSIEHINFLAGAAKSR
jgi:hypothetical protein